MENKEQLLPPLREEQLDEESRKAIKAARRAAEKLRHRKKNAWS